MAAAMASPQPAAGGPDPAGGANPPPPAPRRWRRRRGLFALAAVVVLAGGAGIGAAVSTAPAAGASRLRFVAARTTTLRETLVASGTIEPAQQASLDFTVAGTVAAVDVHSGQTVRAGQPLASLSTTSLSAEVTAAAASVTADQAVVAADSAASAAQQAADEASLASAQSQLTAAQQSLAAATLTAPFAGTVAALSLVPGQAVSGSATSASSTPAGAQVTMLSTSSWVVDAGLVDTQVGAVKVGQPATVVPAGSTSAVSGTVASVGLLPSSSSAGSGGVATYPVEIKVSGDPTGLYPGAGAQVTVVVASVPGAVVVPSGAVHSGVAQTTVLVRQGTTVRRRRVVVGLTSGGLTQIRSGVTAGEDVALQGSASGAGLRGAKTGKAGRGGGAGRGGVAGRGGKAGRASRNHGGGAGGAG